MKLNFAALLLSFAATTGLMSAQTSDQTTTPAPAQTHRVSTPQSQLKHLSNKLALTSDQQNQLLPILTDRQQQVSAVEADTTLNKKERHARLKAIRSDAESKIRSMLTDTQRAAYDQMKQEERARAKSKA